MNWFEQFSELFYVVLVFNQSSYFLVVNQILVWCFWFHIRGQIRVQSQGVKAVKLENLMKLKFHSFDPLTLSTDLTTNMEPKRTNNDFISN